MSDQVSDAVSVDIVGEVGVIRLDDGKANAIGHDAVTGLHAALDRCEADASAVVLVGRTGMFCAGFDLAVMAGDDAAAAASLLHDGAMVCHRLYMHPQPVVAAVTGHALALGAIILMSCDVRYGAEGAFKLGTNEVAIGMPLPRFAVALARDRLSRRHLQTATHHARIYDPAGARDAGYLDALHPPDGVEAAAVAYATEVAGALHPSALRRTREHMRRAVADQLVAGLQADVDEIGPRG